MSTFHDFCNNLSPLTDEAIGDLEAVASKKSYRKGSYLLRANQICDHLFFIEEGLIKSFFRNGEKEFVMRFFAEGVMFSAFDSFISRKLSRFSLIALESTTVTRIAFEDIEKLCAKHHCLETFLRKLISIAAVKMTKRISEMLEGNASDRYDQFVSENSNIIQRINIGDIAKYLGITQQSLSRIRAAR